MSRTPLGAPSFVMTSSDMAIRATSLKASDDVPMVQPHEKQHDRYEHQQVEEPVDCENHRDCQAATGSCTRSRQWEIHRTRLTRRFRDWAWLS
jgi:hypothetical protein